jgi:predicted transport protein
MYIGYSVKKNFCEIHFQSLRLKLWVNVNIDEIQDPMHLCRDVRNIGHYGTGETEFFLERIEDLDLVFGLIEQSFNICIKKYGNTSISSKQEDKMNKYQGLFEFLTNLSATQSSVTFSFDEIEEKIGGELPASAKKYRPWWANEKGGTHSQRLAWMEAGWLVDKVDLKSEKVTFRRE